MPDYSFYLTRASPEHMWASALNTTSKQKVSIRLPLHLASVSSTKEFWNRLIKRVGMFPFKRKTFHSTVAGHINTECRSVKQFASVLSLHAWGKLTAKPNTLFAECDSSLQENLGKWNKVHLLLPEVAPHATVADSTNVYLSRWLTAAKDLISRFTRTSWVCLHPFII